MLDHIVSTFKSVKGLEIFHAYRFKKAHHNSQQSYRKKSLRKATAIEKFIYKSEQLRMQDLFFSKSISKISVEKRPKCSPSHRDRKTEFSEAKKSFDRLEARGIPSVCGLN